MLSCSTPAQQAAAPPSTAQMRPHHTQASLPAQAPLLKTEISVVSYNIYAASRGIDAIAAALKTLDADVIGLQEVDVGTRRSGGGDTVAELARRLNMHAEFAKAMDFDGGSYGVALLSRAPLSHVQRFSLPSSGKAEARVLLLARTRINGVDWQVATTHLASHLDGNNVEQLREQQTRLIAERLGGREHCILMADLNAEADASAFMVLHFVGNFVGLELGNSYPAEKPEHRFDHIIAAPDLVTLDAKLVDTGASDHLAVWAQLSRLDPTQRAFRQGF